MSTQVEIPIGSDLTDEVAEWIEAFREVVLAEGTHYAANLLEKLRESARDAGVATSLHLTTHYRNTIPAEEEVPYPGDRLMERRIKGLIRWNAMAMVHGQNKKDAGILLVLSMHHSHCVPANEPLDATFHQAIAGIGHLFLRRNGISIVGSEMKTGGNSGVSRAFAQFLKEVCGIRSEE